MHLLNSDKMKMSGIPVGGITRTGLILAAVVAAAILWWQPVYNSLSNQEQVRAWTEGFGAWGPIAIVLLTIAQVILAPIPGQAIQAVGGYLYGPWLGTLYSMIGLAIGSFITFWLARFMSNPAMAARMASPMAVPGREMTSGLALSRKVMAVA